MNILQLLADSAARLREYSLSPELDARLLLGFLRKLSFIQLIARGHDFLSPNELADFEALLQRRLKGEPIAYIVGSKEFYGRDFEVGPEVLIPRPESEMLVDAGLEYIELHKTKTLRVLDLGTGSGCLAISLALEAQRLGAACQVSAIDYSLPALRCAQRNAAHHSAKVAFAQADWTQPLLGTFDLIVSNPPYLALSEATIASPETRFEPQSALYAGEKGLDDIECILRQLPTVLAPEGLFLCEVGAPQTAALEALLRGLELVSASGKYRIEKDLAGHARMLRLSLH